jgi:serine/threonine protein kinase
LSDSLQDRFEQARELAPEERSRFLADLDRTDPALAARLRALLDAAEEGGSPLDSDPWAAHSPPDLEEVDELDGAVEERTPLPESIGPYRVLAEIGRGGMGRVYLALQEGEGFARRLAVKVVAPEGSGPEIERRFREERRILAALEHPGIARFHDAGRDRDGRWYLALEYIDGAGLIEHARARNLSTEERLRLFLAVLEAVAFAHAHAVVHRDLKPANILVGADGRPRLLDFGIAKFLDSGDAAATTTHTAMRALTPAYASPEQFRGEPVTPASDVFSLGVLLYELLAGMRPFGGEGASQVALEREILETDPVPPSTASRQAGAHQGSGAGAGSEHSSTSRRLARDLDAICLKALRKNAGERYPSAKELAADLERHLAGLPVAARGDDRRYRAARFLSRNRAAIAVVSALAVAAGALALAIVAGRRGDPAARIEPAPEPFRFGGITGKDVPALEAAFVATPGDVETGARLALALELAGRGDEALLVVARLRQIPDHGADPLIDYVEASIAASAKQSQRALVLFGTALARASASGRGDLVPQIRAARGRLLFTLGRRDEALEDMESARASFERANDPASLARVLNDLAIEPLTNGRLAEGEVLLEQALAASRAAGSSSAGVISMNLAMISLLRGFPDRAELRLRESIENFRRSKSRRLGAAVLNLAQALRDLGRHEEALSVLAEAIALLPSSADEGGLTYALRLRGDDELQSGQLAVAEETAGELEALAKSRGDRLPLAFSNRLRGEIAAARGDFPEAQRRFGEARRQLLENADGDEVEELDVVWAESALRWDELTAAGEIARRVRPEPAAEIEKTGQFVAEAILARLDAQEGRREAAARRLELLAAKAAGSTSVRRRLGLLQASAALATATGSAEAARRDLAAARDIAHTAGRLMEALEIDLESAGIDLAHGRAAEGVASADAVARQASQLGLERLSARARLLADAAPQARK